MKRLLWLIRWPLALVLLLWLIGIFVFVALVVTIVTADIREAKAIFGALYDVVLLPALIRMP